MLFPAPEMYRPIQIPVAWASFEARKYESPSRLLMKEQVADGHRQDRLLKKASTATGLPYTVAITTTP
jgi:hypothetical protein